MSDAGTRAAGVVRATVERATVERATVERAAFNDRCDLPYALRPDDFALAMQDV